MTPAPGAAVVVGVGALNVDYVATHSAMADPDRALAVKRAGSMVAEYAAPLEWGVERTVDADTMRATLAEIDLTSLTATPGGSAFNAVHALARSARGIGLGYVSISGVTPTPGDAPHDHLDRLAIDRRWVRVHDELMGGVCLSIMGDGDRTLLVHPGANALMSRHLREHFDDIVGYLAVARVVHVTSFLDDRTPELLAAVLHEVRAREVRPTIVVDPGHVWCTEPTPSIDRVIAAADVVLLNDREFRALAGVGSELQVGGAEHRAAAQRIRAARLAEAAVVVHKQAGAVWTFTAEQVEAQRHDVLPQGDVEDSTGAGDVFAAGVLTALATDRPLADGVRLGMALARTKIQFAGDAGHGLFAGIAADHLGASER